MELALLWEHGKPKRKFWNMFQVNVEFKHKTIFFLIQVILISEKSPEYNIVWYYWIKHWSMKFGLLSTNSSLLLLALDHCQDGEETKACHKCIRVACIPPCKWTKKSHIKLKVIKSRS